MSFQFARALDASENISENETANSSFGERTLHAATILSVIQGKV